ncbi:RNA-directed DNA polymerase, eukaryota, reverse transcriptase zinc-binding domain protein [Tanacetum coccineum]
MMDLKWEDAGVMETSIGGVCALVVASLDRSPWDKIIANRIKESLKDLISPNQSSFVQGRRITDNILLVQELMHNYHLDRGSPSINGVLHGYFKGKRGIRQGDPLSPYLFTIIMEVLTLILQRRVCIFDDFLYHRYCSNLELVNLCFADDLFLFAHGDSSSARVIMEALDKFKNSSGLTPSLPKSTAYFCNVLNHMKLSILQILPFDEGRLPVKYLGVPLVTSRLISMHVYWDSVFILRTRILLYIEQLVRGFLWCHGDMRRGKAKVSWEVVCLPKKEGESLWVKWIHEYKLRGRQFFEIPCRATCSIWFDRWSPVAPLADVVTSRDIHRAGFGISSKVKDVVFNGGCSADVLEWRNNMGEAKNFSVAAVWNCIRPRSDDWTGVMLFGSRIVWGHMRNLAGLSNVAGSIQVIVDTLIPFSIRRSARSVVATLVVAACSYFIWQERNSKLFNNQKRSFRQVIECIKSSVRLLLSCYFKKSRDALFFKQLWELPDSIIRNA